MGKKRLKKLALAIKKDPNITESELAFILLGAKERPDFSKDDLLSMLNGDRPYDIRPVESLPSSGNVSPVESLPPSGNVSPVERTGTRTGTRTVTKSKAHKRNPKYAWTAANRFRKNNQLGGKTKKKGQRTHRRKKNTSSSL